MFGFGWLGTTMFFVFVLAALWLVIKQCWIYTKSIFDCLINLFVTVVVVFAAILIYAMFTLFISTWHIQKNTENVYGNKVRIYSIGLNNSVEGHFTLGCGSVEGKSVYRFFAKVQGGGYKCYEVDADNTTLIETDGCAPYMQYIKGKRCTCGGNWLMKAYFGDNESFWRDSFPLGDKEQIIYLPKGSIVQTYEIRP